MKHTLDIGSGFVNFGVDIDLAVPPCGAGNHIAFQIDGENILRRNLIEADTMWLHQK
jgi:hypothetical protein